MSDPGYYDDSLRWRRGGSSQNVVASAARTTTGVGTAVPRQGTTAVVTVVVTASAGTTPTLMPRLEGRMADGTWVTLGQAAANITGNGTTRFVCLLAGQAIRPAWTIGGTTPAFTFTMDVEQYA